MVWNSAILYELCITSINSQKSTAPTIKTLFTSPSIENDNFINMVEMTNPGF
jgi:hypothetical protein